MGCGGVSGEKTGAERRKRRKAAAGGGVWFTANHWAAGVRRRGIGSAARSGFPQIVRVANQIGEAGDGGPRSGPRSEKKKGKEKIIRNQTLSIVCTRRHV